MNFSVLQKMGSVCVCAETSVYMVSLIFDDLKQHFRSSHLEFLDCSASQSATVLESLIPSNNDRNYDESAAFSSPWIRGWNSEGE